MENKVSYPSLVEQIGLLLNEGREKAAYAVNTILVQTYWQIGQYIVDFEQQGSDKSVYGSKLIDRLSIDLSNAYGKGFGRSNIIYMRKLFMAFPISGTLSHQLSWSHYYEILKADNELEISFLYLNYFKKEEATEGDNEPVGILLGAYKDHVLVEYATASITNQILLSKYQLYLPDKALLTNKLNKLLV